MNPEGKIGASHLGKWRIYQEEGTAKEYLQKRGRVLGKFQVGIWGMFIYYYI